MDNITYRQATPGDLIMLMEPAMLLYDEHTYEEIHDEMSESLDKDDEAIFISLDKEKAIGFAHCTDLHTVLFGMTMLKARMGALSAILRGYAFYLLTVGKVLQKTL